MADASASPSRTSVTVLGRGVNFGAGTNVANLRHDDGNVRMTVKGGGRTSATPCSERGVNFGAGTNVANLRHDDANVRMTVKGDRVTTPVDTAAGAIVGVRAKRRSTRR